MGLFKRQAAARNSAVPPVGSGWLFRSKLDTTNCLETLTSLIRGYWQPKYSAMTEYVYPGWSWNAPDETPPTTVVWFKDQNDDVVLAAFWAAATGTTVGIFPLVPENISLIADAWQASDATLSPAGGVAAGKITLTAPQITEAYLVDILDRAGLDRRPEYLRAVGLQAAEMFLTKALQFVGAQDKQAVDRFAEAHRYNGEPPEAFCQRILEDLVAQNPDVLPYIQGLPMRMGALLLEDEYVVGIVNRSGS
jgi:hypothetical protein